MEMNKQEGTEGSIKIGGEKKGVDVRKKDE